MTTLNAKANTAYHELIAADEREHPGTVWAGFEHERDAFEAGYEAGHEAAQPVVDREALERVLRKRMQNSNFTAVQHEPVRTQVIDQWVQVFADAVLALIIGGATPDDEQPRMTAENYYCPPASIDGED